MATFESPLAERRLITDRRAAANQYTLTTMDWIAMAVLIIGGVNWGLIGLFNLDLVAMAFGDLTIITRAVYAAVGLAGLYAVYLMARISIDPDRRAS